MATKDLKYELIAQDGNARRGRFETAHGVIETPTFMAVGTQGAVKSCTPEQVLATDTQIVLANTYHMSLHNRTALVERHGGLHKFMHWPKTILTDSGGFQVFSLPEREITEEGVSFQFHEDGEKTFLSPEVSMDVQRRLGADIVMAFDECVDHKADFAYVAASVDRTHRWLKRCAAVELQEHQHLFGIIQGGIELELRTKSAEQICSVDLPGYAIGGVSVGEGLALLEKVVAHTAPLMPADKPRYLMGVGLPEDLVSSVERGMDMFDCVIPTRYAREGTVFTWAGKMRIQDKKFRKDRYAIDTDCTCYTCSNDYSRAYMRHLLFAKDSLAETLMTIHNIHFYQKLMGAMRTAIEEQRFAAWKIEFLATYMPQKSGSPVANGRPVQNKQVNPVKQAQRPAKKGTGDALDDALDRPLNMRPMSKGKNKHNKHSKHNKNKEK